MMKHGKANRFEGRPPCSPAYDRQTGKRKRRVRVRKLKKMAEAVIRETKFGEETKKRDASRDEDDHRRLGHGVTWTMARR